MKNTILHNFKIVLALLIVATTISSCTKNFDEINTDPNNPTEVPNSAYLSSAQRGIMDNTFDTWWGGNVGNQLAQYWSSNQYTSESRYFFRTSITNSYWNLFYAGGNNISSNAVGGLKELQSIIDNCNTDPATSITSGAIVNQKAVAMLLKAWLYQNMTDTWGNIPYSEALNVESRTPKYDSQSSIYSSLLSEVDAAIALIDEAEAGPVGDLIYGGDMASWKKFANTLKMRLAIRMADVNPATANTAFSEAMTSGAFESNADNALMPYGTGTDANPIYYNRYVQSRNDYCASNTMLDVLVALNDPRLSSYYAPASSTGNWTGEVYGLTEANGAATPNSTISQRSAKVLSASLPGIFLDYASVEFMKAEAIERGWVAGTAQDHYNAGITASMGYWTSASSADISDYLAQAGVDYSNTASGATWQQKIGKQKWIALYLQGIQGWTEWRRLDFGILQMPADGILDGDGIPLRMKYPVDEQTLNGTNYDAAVSAQGPDIQTTKVWWDIH